MTIAAMHMLEKKVRAQRSYDTAPVCEVFGRTLHFIALFIKFYLSQGKSLFDFSLAGFAAQSSACASLAEPIGIIPR